jgi:hypothetical protein
LPTAAPGTPPDRRLSKREALARVGKLKRMIVAGSVAAFAILAGLAAGHVTGVTAASSGGGATTPGLAPTAQPDDGGGFFGNQPGGFGIGNNGNNGGQPPVSGTSVS